MNYLDLGVNIVGFKEEEIETSGVSFINLGKLVLLYRSLVVLEL